MTVDSISYMRCGRCEATFVAAQNLPDRETEFSHYLTHENDVDDLRYRQFLSKLSQPLLARLVPNSFGLDYGCGPGPALAHMMAEAGHNMTVYDPFFSPKPPAPGSHREPRRATQTPEPKSPLAKTYDFITCSETAEHFHFPAAEFARFESLLRPKGWLALMTSFQDDDARFANWHYRKDPTHVVFYKDTTLKCLAADLNWSCEIICKDVAIMQKR